MRIQPSETHRRSRSPQNRSFRPVISALSGNPASRKNWIPRQAGNDGKRDGSAEPLFIGRFVCWGISGLMKKSKRKMRTKNASAGDGLLANPRIVARRRLKKPVLWARVSVKGFRISSALRPLDADSRFGNLVRFSSPQIGLLKPVGFCGAFCRPKKRHNGNRSGCRFLYLLMAKGTQNQPQVAFRGAAVWRCGNGRLTRVCKQTGPVSCRAACAASSLRKKQSAANTRRRG